MPATTLLGFKVDIPDAGALLSDAGAFPLDQRVDRHGVVRIRSAAPVEPAVIASIARWFGAFAGYGRDEGVGRRLAAGAAAPEEGAQASAPGEFHQDFLFGHRAAYSILHTQAIAKPLPITFVDLAAVAANLPNLLRTWAGELEERPGRPLLAVHPRTGREILVPPPRRGGHIEGLPDAQAASLVDELWTCIDASPHRRELELAANDLLVWDGLATAYAHPPLLHAEGVRFLVVPLDPALALARPGP